MGMNQKQYWCIELFLLVILVGLCISIYKKENRIVESNSKSVNQEKICYLTFDDGPSNHTEEILDILKKYDAKATFFVIGEELSEERSKVLERIQKEGHAIGLHSYVHDFELVYCTPQACLKDFEAEYTELKEKYGIDTRIFRFPGGSACTYMGNQRKEYIRLMQSKGYRCFDWNVSGEDSYGSPSVWSIQNNIFQTFFDYSRPIILLHDANVANVTVDALPEILERIKEEGYLFETLMEAKEYIYR